MAARGRAVADHLRHRRGRTCRGAGQGDRRGGLGRRGRPNIAQQCLDAGLLDEVRINLVPVLLGKGIRYFDKLSNAPFALEDPRVIQGTGVTHLIYRVAR